MIRVITRNREHVMAGTDRYRVLRNDNSREERRAEELCIGDILLGSGKIVQIERLEVRGNG